MFTFFDHVLRFVYLMIGDLVVGVGVGGVVANYKSFFDYIKEGIGYNGS